MEPEEGDPLEYLEKLDRFLNGEEQTTLYFELEKIGCAPCLTPEKLSDEELHTALTDLVWAMCDLGVCFEDADHLSDRELYAFLARCCDEPTVVFPDHPNAWHHLCPAEEDWEAYLRYYADDDMRAEELAEGNPVPPKELPPYYRSWLPWRANLED
ncbi:MAG: hypothetical protein ACAH95_13740 [Fimbriimonas sp.]